jgi:hypothetical protein
MKLLASHPKVGYSQVVRLSVISTEMALRIITPVL